MLALQLCHEGQFRSIPQLIHLHALGRGQLCNLEGFVDNLMRVCKIDSAAKTTGISPTPTLDLYTWGIGLMVACSKTLTELAINRNIVKRH